MGEGLFLFMALLSLILLVGAVKVFNGVATARKKSGGFNPYGLQFFVDMHKMKKQNRTIIIDNLYVELASSQYQPLVTMMLKLSPKGYSNHSNALSKDWLIKRICVGGVDICTVPIGEGKIMLKASIGFLKYKNLRSEWIEMPNGGWNVKGFIEGGRLNSVEFVNIYLSETKPTQISETNTISKRIKPNLPDKTKKGTLLLMTNADLVAGLVQALQEYSQQREVDITPSENQSPSSDIQCPSSAISEIGEGQEEVTETVSIADLIRALQEHIRQREVGVASSESQSTPSVTSEIIEQQEVVVMEEPTDKNETINKSGNIHINKLDSSSELVVSIPAISVFEAIKIMDERKKRGYYTNLDDMKKRLDIASIRLDELAEYICFSLPE